MKMSLKQFRIGQLAKELHVERFVIRFWEKEFNIKSIRSEGGQRFYTDKDLEKFRIIKSLLYEQGLTIAGAKKYFGKKISNIAAHKTTMDDADNSILRPKQQLIQELLMVKKQLIKLRQLL